MRRIERIVLRHQIMARRKERLGGNAQDSEIVLARLFPDTPLRLDNELPGDWMPFCVTPQLVNGLSIRHAKGGGGPSTPGQMRFT